MKRRIRNSKETDLSEMQRENSQRLSQTSQSPLPQSSLPLQSPPPHPQSPDSSHSLHSPPHTCFHHHSYYPTALRAPRSKDDVKMSDFRSNADLIPNSEDHQRLETRRASNDTSASGFADSRLLDRPVHQRCDFFKGLLLCQVVSALVCGTAVFSTLLVRHQVDIPTLQSFGNYFCLALVFTLSFAFKTPKDALARIVSERWWKYLLIALFDVEGNYLMVKAYRYTSITSVQLLDSVTIPVVLLLSWVVLKYRYLWIHFVGVGVAMAGMTLMIYADYRRNLSETSARDDADDARIEAAMAAWTAWLAEDVNSSHSPPMPEESFVSDVENSTGDALTTAFPTDDDNNDDDEYYWLGDLLAILGASCYGFSNVGQEYFVSASVGVGAGDDRRAMRSSGAGGSGTTPRESIPSGSLNNGGNSDGVGSGGGGVRSSGGGDRVGSGGGGRSGGGGDTGSTGNNIGSFGQLHEFLAFLGLFGCLVNGLQFLILEWREASLLTSHASSHFIFLYIFGFNVCLFLMYSIVPLTLKLTSAAVFNISLLTSDFYTFLFGIFLFGLKLDYYYFLAYSLVIVGIVVYSWKVVPHR